MKSPVFHVVFVEHPSKYEFIAHPTNLKPDQINYVLYRSFSSLDSLRKFKDILIGRVFIKFGWHDLTKVQKLDVLEQYSAVDFVEFVNTANVTPGTLVDQIKKS